MSVLIWRLNQKDLHTQRNYVGRPEGAITTVSTRSELRSVMYIIRKALPSKTYVLAKRLIRIHITRWYKERDIAWLALLGV